MTAINAARDGMAKNDLKHGRSIMPQSAFICDPAGITRRAVMVGTAVGLVMAPTRPAAKSPRAEMTVTEALRQRRSTRAFADRPIDPALLAELLWAAFGINRPSVGLHTAPSWRGAADTMIHVASAEGVTAYDTQGDTLMRRATVDIRATLSPQPFVATAPICLLHISDLRRLVAAKEDQEKRIHAQVDAAIIAQNVYLFAAARGLATCLVGGVDRSRIGEALSLKGHEFVTFVQPVGWPRE